jgi:hypothetical protein
MLHIAIEKGRRWDLALACASLSLVMLFLTGVLHSQITSLARQRPQSAMSTELKRSVALPFQQAIGVPRQSGEASHPGFRSYAGKLVRA